MNLINKTYKDSRIHAFIKKYEGVNHFLLACHAAIPVAITPDLLYKLWLNFQMDEKGAIIKMPITTVADILASPICRKIGYHLFEIHPTIRAELQETLESDSRFEVERVRRIAQFLQAYLEFSRDKIPSQLFYEALNLVSLSILDPKKAAEKVFETFKEEQLSTKEKIAKANIQLNWFAVPTAKQQYQQSGTGILNTTKLLVEAFEQDSNGQRQSALQILARIKPFLENSLVELEESFQLPIKRQLLVELELIEGEENKAIKVQIKEKFQESKQTKILDLSGLQLKTFPKWLKDIAHIEELILDDNILEAIHIPSSLKKLKKLSLANNKLVKIDGVEKFKKLVELNLNDNEIINIDVLKELEDLQSLQLNKNKVRFIDSLQTLNNLTTVFISGSFEFEKHTFNLNGNLLLNVPHVILNNGVNTIRLYLNLYNRLGLGEKKQGKWERLKNSLLDVFKGIFIEDIYANYLLDDPEKVFFSDLVLLLKILIKKKLANNQFEVIFSDLQSYQSIVENFKTEILEKLSKKYALIKERSNDTPITFEEGNRELNKIRLAIPILLDKQTANQWKVELEKQGSKEVDSPIDFILTMINNDTLDKVLEFIYFLNKTQEEPIFNNKILSIYQDILETELDYLSSLEADYSFEKFHIEKQKILNKIYGLFDKLDVFLVSKTVELSDREYSKYRNLIAKGETKKVIDELLIFFRDSIHFIEFIFHSNALARLRRFENYGIINFETVFENQINLAILQLLNQLFNSNHSKEPLPKNIYSQVYQILTEKSTEESIKSSLQLAATLNDVELENEFILLSGRLTRLKNTWHSGVITDKYYDFEISKIREALLSIIEKHLTKKSIFCWCLDNGHGKLTSGKRSPKLKDGTQLYEYEFNRDIVKRIIKILETLGISYFEVVPEIEVDNFLAGRVLRVNNLETEKPKLLVSIHCNTGLAPSGQWSTTNGIETWHTYNSKTSKKLATTFQKHLLYKLKWKDRGIKAKPVQQLYVLKHSDCPTILTENGFYNNKEQLLELMKEEVREKIAEAHVEAILEIEENWETFMYEYIT